MKNLALNKLFDQILRRMIAPRISPVEIVENFPNLALGRAFFYTESRNFRARFDNPGRGNGVQKFADFVRVKNPAKFRAGNSDSASEISHSQFVPKPESIGIADTFDLQMFTRFGGV